MSKQPENMYWLQNNNERQQPRQGPSGRPNNGQDTITASIEQPEPLAYAHCWHPPRCVYCQLV